LVTIEEIEKSEKSSDKPEKLSEDKKNGGLMFFIQDLNFE
jgi:hypothetical protein